jgi:hypothetical protein
MVVETFEHAELMYGVNEGSFMEEMTIHQPTEEDIVNDKIYSIQEAKLLAEEDNKRNDANTRK